MRCHWRRGTGWATKSPSFHRHSVHGDLGQLGPAGGVDRLADDLRRGDQGLRQVALRGLRRYQFGPAFGPPGFGLEFDDDEDPVGSRTRV